MSNTVIKIEGVGKRYRYGELKSNMNLRDDVMTWLKGFSRPAGKKHLSMREVHERHIDESPEYFWALRDFNLDVEEGELVGIIGRNGAGKSTLLKILSRITLPTTGRITYHGRISSLLEVGTGFHRDLTGRENVYLNGSILGMKRAEIQRKFDRIVDFAELHKFIDTPVKFYSSGMAVRLAFAVAAHLEPEILIIDEVLAVGDAPFQRKCLEKMEDVAKQGMTVLFVSHNMTAMQSLCTKAVWLEKGRIVKEGPTQPVVQAYLQSTLAAASVPLSERIDRTGDGSARIVSLLVESLDPDKVIRSGSRLKIEVGYRSKEPIQRPLFALEINDFAKSICVYHLRNPILEGVDDTTIPAEGVATCITEPINLTPGRCTVDVEILRDTVKADYLTNAGVFDVELEEPSQFGFIPPRKWATSLLEHKWSVNQSTPVLARP